MSRNAQTYCALRSPCMRPRASTTACIASIVEGTRRATHRKIFHRVHARPSRTTHVRNPAHAGNEHWMQGSIVAANTRAVSTCDQRHRRRQTKRHASISDPTSGARGMTAPRSCIESDSAPKKMAALRAAIGCWQQRNLISDRRLRAARHRRPGPAGR